MNWEEICREEYQANRYLRNATDVRIKNRLQDLALNLWSTDAEGNVIASGDETRLEYSRLYIHALQEQALRRGVQPARFQEEAVRKKSAFLARYRPPQLTSQFTPPAGCFTKFGERLHILNSGSGCTY